jgi:uncharacterized protein YkwD
MKRVLQGAAAAALALAASCGAPPGPPATVPESFVRYGAKRDDLEYSERAPAAKRVLLRQINADREAHGAPAVKYDLLAAKVGDEFCAESAGENFTGHWDLAGHSPYLRWALAGGVDFEAENVGSLSRAGRGITGGEIADLLLDVHREMMAERPPADGHRRAILDPKWTHVGIGVAWAGGELRMTEEFVRRVAEWVEMPAGPLPRGSTAVFRAKLPDGWTAGALEVSFEPVPSPLTRRQIARRSAYALPKAFVVLYPTLSPPLRYADGGTGDLSARDGRIEGKFPLSKGAGSYYAVLYGAKGPVAPGRTLWPLVVARYEAR